MLQVSSVDFTIAQIVLPLINACSDNYQVEIACAQGPESLRLEKEGYIFRYIPFSRSLDPLAIARSFFFLIRLFRSERYDIVHTHTPVAGVVARLAAWLCRVPRVVNSVHGFYFHENSHPFTRWAAALVERWMGRITDFSLFVSHEDLETAIALGICTPQSGLWIANGVDQKRFDPERPELERAAAAVRSELGAAPDDILVGTVARMVREKGIDELLGAFAMLQGANPSIRLVLVGDVLESDRDGMRERINEALKDPGYGSRIHWLGFRRDVEVLLRAMDVFVLPSYREGMPLSVIEAMSMGLPVVATDIRGCREAVIDGVTGFLVPHRKVQPLATAIRRLLEDPVLRGRMGQAGLVRARELYDERAVLDRQLGVLRRLICREG